MRFEYRLVERATPLKISELAVTFNALGGEGFHCKHAVDDLFVFERRAEEAKTPPPEHLPFPPAPQGPVELHPKAPWKLWHNAQGESATVKSLQDAGLAELVKAVKAQPQGKTVVLDGLETWWTVFLGEERVHRKFKVMVK